MAAKAGWGPGAARAEDCRGLCLLHLSTSVLVWATTWCAQRRTTFDPEHRRKGIASALMGALLDAYPGSRSSRAVGRTVWRELASCRRFEARACPTTRVDASPWGKTASALSADDRGVGWGRLTPNELELLPGSSGPCWSGLEHRPKHEARIWVGAVE